MSETAATQLAEGRELYVRTARLDGRPVARLRALEQGERCVVEIEVWQSDTGDPVRPGPHGFATAVEATRFVTLAVEAFIALGCDVVAS